MRKNRCLIVEDNLKFVEQPKVSVQKLEYIQVINYASFHSEATKVLTFEKFDFLLFDNRLNVLLG